MKCRISCFETPGDVLFWYTSDQLLKSLYVWVFCNSPPSLSPPTETLNKEKHLSSEYFIWLCPLLWRKAAFLIAIPAHCIQSQWSPNTLLPKKCSRVETWGGQFHSLCDSEHPPSWSVLEEGGACKKHNVKNKIVEQSHFQSHTFTLLQISSAVHSEFTEDSQRNHVIHITGRSWPLQTLIIHRQSDLIEASLCL